jgi:threonine dehydratase
MITPLEKQAKLAEIIGVSDIYFKREDLHPYGSHKGRSIPVMIEHYLAAGDRVFAISSSGNAALAAALYIQEKNQSRGNETPLTLDIFVGNHVAPRKLQKIQAIADANPKTIRILIKERPLQALTQATQDGARSLRQSTDDEALVGYQSLAEELAADAASKKIAAVFIGTSSGTTAQALATYFLKKNLPIQVHIVQTSTCHPLAEAFETYDGPDERSVAEAISDITARRKDILVPLVEKTGGSGWIATNDDIRAAQELVEKHTDLNISSNSALSVVGVMKAVYTSHQIDGAVVCMICGE